MCQGNRAPEGHEVPVVARLHNGAHSALDVVAQGVGQLGAAQVDLVVRHHRTNSKTCCPPETKLGPSMWSTLKGLVGEAGGAAG